MSKEFKDKKYTAAVLTAFAIFLFINLGMESKLDDASFIKHFADAGGSLILWGKEYWNTWSSRVICHGTNVLLLQAGGMWFGLLNALFMTAMLCLAVKFACGQEDYSRKPALLAAAFIAYMYSIPYKVRLEADLWKTATVIYLWGTVCRLWCMLLAYNSAIKNIRPEKWRACLGVIAAIYASNCEQSAAMLIGFCSLMEIYSVFVKKRPVSRSNITILRLCALGFLLCLTAPGNKARDAAEILGSYAFFHSSSLLEKGFFGIITAVKFITQYLPGLMFALSLALSIYIYKSNQGKILSRISAVPAAYFGVYLLLQWMRTNYPGQEIPLSLDSLLYNIFPLFPQQVSYSPRQWLSTALAVFVCILLGLLAAFCLPEEDGLPFGLMYGAAFAIIAVIGFTTAGRITGRRTVFPSAMLLIIVLTRLVRILDFKTGG